MDPHAPLAPEADDVVHVQQGLQRRGAPDHLVLLLEHTEVVSEGVPLGCWGQDDLGSQDGSEGQGRDVAVELVDEPCRDDHRCFLGEARQMRGLQQAGGECVPVHAVYRMITRSRL